MVASGAAASPKREPGQSEPAAGAAEIVQLLWVGSRGGMEKELVERAGIDFEAIDTGQLRVANPVKVVRNLGRMTAGVQQSLAIVDRFRPAVCFVTGGYVCGPVVVACALRKVPVLIYLPDMSPGYAIRMLSTLATRVAVSFPEVAHWFGGEAPAGKAVVTGYPVRAEVVEAAHDRALARRQLGAALGVPLEAPQPSQAPRSSQALLPLLLVWGGSSGSRAINQATWGALPALLPVAQIVHIVGARDWPLYEAWAAAHPLPVEMQERYHPVAYLHEAMPLALAAADLTVARAGASTLGEFPVCRLPSVLAPLHSVNQADNAQALAGRGGAVIVEDADLPAQLGATVVKLLADHARRQGMEQALAQMAQPEAAQHIAEEMLRLAQS